MQNVTSWRERFCGRQARGTRRETGGPNNLRPKATLKRRKSGTAKSGTSRSLMMAIAVSHSIVFTAIPARADGSPMPVMTDASMYIELHSRSAFSFLEGASVPEELADACHAHQMPAMALLDRDGVYGAARFHLAMKKLGLQAHIGAEVTSLLPYVPLSDNVTPPRISLLCASRKGYQNLCRLITRTKLRAPKYPAKLPRKHKRAETEELLPQPQAVA